MIFKWLMLFIAILNDLVEKTGKKKNTNYDVNKGTYVKNSKT